MAAGKWHSEYFNT